MQLRSVSLDSEEGVHLFVCFEEFAAVARFDGVRLDVVGIHRIENDNVVVASVGCYGEAAGLVCEQLAVDVERGHEDHVCFVIVWCLFVFDHVIEHRGCLAVM